MTGSSQRRSVGRTLGASDGGSGDRSGRGARKGEDKDPAQRARDLCYRLLAGRPRTRTELRDALARKGIEDGVAEEVLGKFVEAGLVDDADFAEVWVRSRHRNQGLGKRALKHELVRKGIDAETAADAVAELEDEAEEERARALVAKRMSGLGRVDETTAVRRLVGMLARKGYPEGLAFRIVREELRSAGRDAAPLDEPAPTL